MRFGDAVVRWGAAMVPVGTAHCGDDGEVTSCCEETGGYIPSHVRTPGVGPKEANTCTSVLHCNFTIATIITSNCLPYMFIVEYQTQCVGFSVLSKVSSVSVGG